MVSYARTAPPPIRRLSGSPDPLGAKSASLTVRKMCCRRFQPREFNFSPARGRTSDVGRSVGSIGWIEWTEWVVLIGWNRVITCATWIAHRLSLIAFRLSPLATRHSPFAIRLSPFKRRGNLFPSQHDQLFGALTAPWACGSIASAFEGRSTILGNAVYRIAPIIRP